MKWYGFIAAIGALLASAAPATARTLTLIYTGAFSEPDQLVSATGGPDLITRETAFELEARFSTDEDIAPAFLPGIAAFRPIFARFTIGGVLYRPDPALSDFAVAIFDRDNMFGPRNSGRYGVGWIVEADIPPSPGGPGDGPGNIGDFFSASPDFSVANIVPTVFQQFQGAGFAGGPGCGLFPGACALTPLNLIGPGGERFQLQLEREREDELIDGGPLQTAQIVPGPAAIGLFGLLAAGLATLRRRA